MDTTKNDQSQRLHTFFQNEQFSLMRKFVYVKPWILRTNDDTPWLLTTDEVETILHEHAPELSATVSGPTIVIFHKKRPAN